MRTSIALTAIACVLGTAGASHAAHLASPSIYGAVTQRAAACTIGNTGPTPVSVTVHIVDESGNVVPSASSCNTPVEAGFVCSVFANNIPNAVAFACTADVSGSAKHIRASLTLRDVNGVPLRTADLR
jgi:hypothetical protein